METPKAYSIDPNTVEFTGTYASEFSRQTILAKLDAFVSEDFEYFRDLADEEELELREAGSSVTCFGNSRRWYYIYAKIDDRQDVRFVIYDEDGADIIAFVLSRMAEYLKTVEIYIDDIQDLQHILNLLIEPSWID